MPENGIMKFVTVAAIVAVLYLFLKYRTAGTSAQIQPNAVPKPLPAIGCCDSCVAFVPENSAIPIATNYLCCAPAHSPAASTLVARAAKIIPPMPQPVAVPQNSSQPHGVAQSCCVAGISVAQSKKIFPPITKVTVRSQNGCFTNCNSTIGGCGPNVRCLRASGICCTSLSLLGSNCVDV